MLPTICQQRDETPHKQESPLPHPEMHPIVHPLISQFKRKPLCYWVKFYNGWKAIFVNESIDVNRLYHFIGVCPHALCCNALMSENCITVEGGMFLVISLVKK